LKMTEEARVIQPSRRMAVTDYAYDIDCQELNRVSKADTYPLSWIDDLLDQLGQCQYFSTLNLTSGYWQI